MKNLVFIFCFLAISILAKAADKKESTMAVENESLQWKTHFSDVSDNLCSDISFDEYDSLAEETENWQEIRLDAIFVFSTATKQGNKQNKRLPFIYDLPPPDML